MKGYARRAAAVLAVLASAIVMQVSVAGSANAASCTMTGSGMSRAEYCSGIRNEVLAAKFVDGTNQWSVNAASMYFNGNLVDKAADSECTWMRIKVTNAYWPSGNIYTQPDWKVCGAGNNKIVGIYLDQAWMYPGKVEFQHCALTGGTQILCPTIFSRNV